MQHNHINSRGPTHTHTYTHSHPRCRPVPLLVIVVATKINRQLAASLRRAKQNVNWGTFNPMSSPDLGSSNHGCWSSLTRRLDLPSDPSLPGEPWAPRWLRALPGRQVLPLLWIAVAHVDKQSLQDSQFTTKLLNDSNKVCFKFQITHTGLAWM